VVVAIPMVKKFDDMFNRFDRIPACDGRTNRQTDRQADIMTVVSTGDSVQRARFCQKFTFCSGADPGICVT